MSLGFVRVTLLVTALSPRGAEPVRTDPFMTLGVRATAPSLVGASLAAVGMFAWTLSRDGKLARRVTIGPRLYCAGGGLGFTLRW
jgi:hypothetical protein